jgi:uncharacterized protein YegJ (DUF2314 family)
VGFESGDYVKFEIKDGETGAAEWMWLRADSVDESRRILYGWLDSQPVVFATTVKLGQRLAISYDNIREHRKSNEF